MGAAVRTRVVALEALLSQARQLIGPGPTVEGASLSETWVDFRLADYRVQRPWKKVMRVPKYLIQSTYTTEGVRGLLKEGGSGRATQTENLIASLGGRLESFYFAFGGEDVCLIADLPDNTMAAAIGFAATASGAVRTKTVVLLTPDEIDRATQQTVNYRPPGAQ
jgi:uncharacterized protein with GYD domain